MEASLSSVACSCKLAQRTARRHRGDHAARHRGGRGRPPARRLRGRADGQPASRHRRPIWHSAALLAQPGTRGRSARSDLDGSSRLRPGSRDPVLAEDDGQWRRAAARLLVDPSERTGPDRPPRGHAAASGAGIPPSKLSFQAHCACWAPQPLWQPIRSAPASQRALTPRMVSLADISMCKVAGRTERVAARASAAL